MNNEERKALKEKIRASIDGTKQEITELKELTKPISPENAIGRVSRMDAINNKSINDAALQQAITKLDRLEFALKRSDDEDFGNCRRCGQNIPMGRLLLMPQSAFCVSCASR